MKDPERGETPGQVFGEWDAPATDDDVPIPVPVELTCIHCGTRFEEGHNGRIDGFNGYAYHRECHLRSVLGGIGHQVDHERYCTLEGDPDAGLPYYVSSLLVWEWFMETQMHPRAEQLLRWRRRVNDVRESQG